jgi:hypothetical protein
LLARGARMCAHVGLLSLLLGGNVVSVRDVV